MTYDNQVNNEVKEVTMNVSWKDKFPKKNRYFETDNGILFNQDCVEILKQFPSESIDLVVTSPPYDNLRYYGVKNEKELENIWNFEKFKQLAKELYRIMKKGGVVVWIVADTTKNFCESLTSFKQAIYFVEEVGFNLLDTMAYVKQNYPPAYPNLKRYANQFEYMFIFVKGKPVVFNPIKVKKVRNRMSKVAFRQKDGSLIRKIIEKGDEYKQATNVWSYSVAGNSSKDKIAYVHPAIFPEQLAHDHIISWSNEGDIVLDPFIGSGTTLVACEKLNRRWIGIEIEEKYCEIAKKRIEEATRQRKLFGV
jgi:site-specific DNA-methyltransferase (adenine-specific)